jgi:hypothetical protein
VQLTRDQLIDLVERIQRADYETEVDGDRLLTRLKQSVPDPAVSDLIFWHEPPLSAAEDVDRALSYRSTDA